MFEWFWKLWNDGGNVEDHNSFNRYNIPVMDKHKSHLIKWSTFECMNYNFNYRYVINQNNIKCFNIIDFFKGLNVNHDCVYDCDWNDNEIYHLNEIIFPKSNSDRSLESLGSLFATQKGIANILKKLQFENKIEVIMNLMRVHNVERDHLHDKIETVLKHVRNLNENSEKFLECHETFKTEVSTKFANFETRLNELNTKLNTIQTAEKIKNIVHQHVRDQVMFPRDITKHQRLAVFSERVDDHTRLAFVSGQESHFRKRKAQFEDDMEVLYDDVHPNPLLAIHCISENFYNKNYKVNKLGKRVINVNCDVNVAKNIVHEVV
jgi:Protein of unknown function (DUF3627)